MYYGVLDWGTVPDWAAALLTALSILLAAYLGLRAWKSQLHGTYGYELAKKITLSAYKLKDAIRGVRNPWVDGDAEEAYQNRWKKVLEVARELRTSLMEAQVVWDKTEANSLLDEMDNLLNKLYLSIDFLLMDKKDKPANAADQLFTKDMAEILYAGRSGGKDNFAEETDHLISKFEALARPHLKL